MTILWASTRANSEPIDTMTTVNVTLLSGATPTANRRTTNQ
jgi:hypothetical protein